MIFISAVFILVGFVTAKIIANYISKPLSKLEVFTQKIAAKDWKEPISLKNKDEIGRLAISMNKMQESLKRADEEEKMFLQSISHDLKTPVMVIMSHADAIIDGVYIDNLDKTAQIIKDEAISLNKKIKQLLYLNTLDYLLGNQLERSEIELDNLIKRNIEKFKMLGSDLKWRLNIEPTKVKGNEEKLTVAIDNIIENAIRYAKSEICVSVKKTKRAVRIEISNDGNPISPENLDKIFQNLYKDKTGNFGLGLAITKKVIAFFGGSVYAENNKRGVCFIINYPL
jgi:two-component system sensor histidine kinase CssS